MGGWRFTDQGGWLCGGTGDAAMPCWHAESSAPDWVWSLVAACWAGSGERGWMECSRCPAVLAGCCASPPCPESPAWLCTRVSQVTVGVHKDISQARREGATVVHICMGQKMARIRDNVRGAYTALRRYIRIRAEVHTRYDRGASAVVGCVIHTLYIYDIDRLQYVAHGHCVARGESAG